jgi:hypothetical protein
VIWSGSEENAAGCRLLSLETYGRQHASLWIVTEFDYEAGRGPVLLGVVATLDGAIGAEWRDASSRVNKDKGQTWTKSSCC